MLTPKEQEALSLKPGDKVIQNHRGQEVEWEVVVNDLCDMQTIDPVFPPGIGGSIHLANERTAKEFNWVYYIKQMRKAS